MAQLGDNTIRDTTLKMALSVSSTTNDKYYFEEAYSWRPQIHSSDVFAETVPLAANRTIADANVAANPTILAKRTDYVLTAVPGSNGQAYALYQTPGNASSPRLINFVLPQKFGTGYAIILKQNNNTIINLTDGAYYFDYANGILRFDPTKTPSILGYSMPLKITVYQYIGKTLADAIAGGGGLSPG